MAHMLIPQHLNFNSVAVSLITRKGQERVNHTAPQCTVAAASL